SIRQAPAICPVGIDNPDILLTDWFAIISFCWLNDGAECQFFAIGAPGGLDDGGVGTDGDLSQPAGLSIHQIKRPKTEPPASALPCPLERNAISRLVRRPTGIQPIPDHARR